MNSRLISLLLLLLPACTTERTVYDAGGHAVSNALGGPRRMSLEDRFTRNYDSTVRTKKNADGIPVSTSSKVSSFQRYFDKSTSPSDSGLFNKRFRGSRNFSTASYDDASKKFGGDKRYTTSTNRAFAPGLQPDFMNESKGLAHRDYQGGDRRWSGEGVAAAGSSTRYPTPAAPYSTINENGYISSRNSRFRQPRVVSSREYLGEDSIRLRSVLKHDNGVPDPVPSSTPTPPSTQPPSN